MLFFFWGGGGERSYLNATLGALCSCMRLVVCFYRKALDNNDLNQVRLTSGFVKSRVCWGCSVSQAHKTWSRTFLFVDFRF